jgi:hypothetical protein
MKGETNRYMHYIDESIVKDDLENLKLVNIAEEHFVVTAQMLFQGNATHTKRHRHFSRVISVHHCSQAQALHPVVYDAFHLIDRFLLCSPHPTTSAA